ncbi:response regulator PleD [mine drainage metagenome]|uniref:Response regulator PleD n=1 Tax=mine drainage metagenome TaxID=410659 RepID=A0A1J5QDQ8_9ZZZZ
MHELAPRALAQSTKGSLVVLSHAIERAFDVDVDGRAVPGLVIALFERREYFDVEAARYGALASAGHLVLVAFAGSTQGLPAGVHGVMLPVGSPEARDWSLVMVRGSFAGALVAHDLRDLAVGELTLEASRLFAARWTFHRARALQMGRDLLERLGDLVPPGPLAAAQDLLEAAGALPVSGVEIQLAALADELISSVEAAHGRATRLRVDLEASQALAERDQLTGLHNRRFLERYLGQDERPVDFLTLLVDVDDLKHANDTYGHLAGDAVLRTVASVLNECSRSGDVIVRWGGDEFVLLVPDLGAQASLRVGERLARAVSAARPAPPWDHLRLSVSIAVSETHRTPLPLDRLDETLAAIKRSGKGHAALAPSVPGAPAH